MFVQKARIRGFSSFADSEWIEFSPGINMVVGENNSGKSALLRAIAPSIPLNKHRDENNYLEGFLPNQIVELNINTNTRELRERLAQSQITVQTTGNGPSVADHDQVKNWFSTNSDITLKCSSTNGNDLIIREPIFQEYIKNQNDWTWNVAVQAGELQITSNGSGRVENSINAYTNSKSLAFFNFSAQRLNVSKFGYARQERLAGDASNLPAVLAHYAGSFPEHMLEIQARVRDVVPSVAQITIDPINDGYEIIIWPKKGLRQRELAFSLSECGTGVAQIIAIFTAVVISNQNTIVVDEINSFLHPYATKRLLSILSTEYSNNQYILSSHSSEAIAHPSVDKMVIVEREGFKSSVKSVDRTDLSEISNALRSLGISMTDVLGADGIFWVEGPTEELVFAELLQRELGGIPLGMRISAVASTGDFSRRGSSKKAVTDLYERVTKSVAPMAIGQRFLLDRERLTDEDVRKFENETGGKLRFLPRRCIECYAIDPIVISNILRNEADLEIDAFEIETKISELAKDKSYGGVTHFKGDIRDHEWLKRTDGAKILSRLFQELSGARLEYRKTHHTPLILSRTDPEGLKELIELLNVCVAEIQGSR